MNDIAVSLADVEFAQPLADTINDLIAGGTYAMLFGSAPTLRLCSHLQLYKLAM